MHIWKIGKWPDMSVTNIPWHELVIALLLFVKMLSIIVADVLETLVGLLISGIKPYEYKVLIKLLVAVCLSKLRRLMFQSPIK